MSYYSDGSGGGSTLLFPFTSEDQARAYALELCEEAIGRWRNKTPDAPCPYYEIRMDAHKAASFLRHCGLSVPEDLAADIRNEAVSKAQSLRDRKVQELADAEADLAKVSA